MLAAVNTDWMNDAAAIRACGKNRIASSIHQRNSTSKPVVSFSSSPTAVVGTGSFGSLDPPKSPTSGSKEHPTKARNTTKER